MERRRGIPLVAIIIFIVLLAAIIITCIIILNSGKDQTTKTSSETSQTPSKQEEPDSENPDDDVGEEYTDEDSINNSTEIQDAFKIVGNKKTFAKYAIYNLNEFDTEDVDNEFKLQLAMSQVSNSDIDNSSSNKAIDKDVIEGYLEDVFGSSDDIEYKDFSLYNSDTNFTEQYKTIGYIYDKDTAMYTFNESDIEEENPSEIVEIITKAVVYNSKVEIYVKPIYVRTTYDNGSSSYIRSLYKSYDFTRREFPNSDHIISIYNSDYQNVLKSSYNGDVDGLNYGEVNGNIDLNQLTEYKYTLTRNGDEYNLKSFEEVDYGNGNSSNSNNDSGEMSAQDIAIFNGQFDAYVGTGRSASEARAILDAIIDSNSTRENELDKIVTVVVGSDSAALDDEDVDGLNEEIEGLKDYIDDSKTYNIKATYKSQIIVTIEIQEE